MTPPQIIRTYLGVAGAGIQGPCAAQGLPGVAAVDATPRSTG